MSISADTITRTGVAIVSHDHAGKGAQEGGTGHVGFVNIVMTCGLAMRSYLAQLTSPIARGGRTRGREGRNGPGTAG